MYIVYIKYLTPHYTLCIQYAMEDLFEYFAMYLDEM